MPRGAQGELSVPSHTAEEPWEALAGGLQTAPHMKKKVWQALVWDLGLFPVQGKRRGRGGVGSFVFLFVWSRVN